MTENTNFDPLQALSLARTALDDPASLPAEVEIDGEYEDEFTRRYAVDRIDEVIGALHFEPANDFNAEAVWVLTHLGRLISNVHDTLDREGVDDELLSQLTLSLDHLDTAIGQLS